MEREEEVVAQRGRERERSGTKGEGGVIFVVGATKRETEWRIRPSNTGIPR